MNDEGQESGHPEYDALPRAIRDVYTLKQWLWLSDAAKARLEITETEPEGYFCD